MSRKVVRVGVFLLVASLALIAKGIYGDEPNPKPAAGGDDPFSPEPPKSAAAGPLAVPEKYGRLLRTITVEDDRQTYGDFNDDGYWSGTEWKGHKNLPAGYWVYMAPQWYIFAEAATASAGPTKSVAKKPAISDDGGFGDETPPSAKPAKAAKPVPAAVANAKPKSPAKLHGGEKAILAALKRKASFDFTEMPLEDVIAHISNKYRIPIVRDQSGLKDAGVDPETPVTCHLSGISLQSALELMLDELQLKWTIHHEVLMITSSSKAESVDLLYTKVYDVADLVRQQNDEFVLQDNPLTGASTTVFNSLSTANMPLSGSFAEGGPHYAENGPRRVGSPTRDFAQQIVASITSGISENSWRDGGGNGTISRLGDRLVVCQSREIHRQIQQLLAQLRHSRRSMPTLRVELYWLWLDAAHRKALCQSGIQTDENGDQEIEARRLSAMVSEVPHFRVQTTSLNAHGTSVAAGDRRSLICAAIPVDVMYSPIVTMPNVGVTAELRPTLLHSKESAELYVRSTITRWAAARPPAMVGAMWPESKYVNADAQPSTNPKSSHVSFASHGAASSSCPIDLPVMPTQEFGTTLRVPLGKPVVIGSVTFAPAGDAGVGEAKQDAMEIYLIATTSLVKSAVKKAK